MHGAQAVMPGVACLYRCVGGFVIPDLTNTDNFGVTSYSRTQSGSKTDHITPDFCLMRWEQIVFISQDIFHRVFICHDFGVGEIVHNVTVQC